MAETQIEWTDATWNPVAGCSIITAGCTNCYAMEMAKRLEAMGIAKYVNRRAKGTPYRRPKGTPARRLVPVVHRGDPRAAECPSRG